MPIGSKGTKLGVGMTSPVPEEMKTDTYQDVCVVTDYSESGETTEEIDVTTTCDEERKFITGFSDPGTATLTINWDPQQAGFKRMKALKDSGELGNFRVTLPDDGQKGGPVIYYFKAFVQTISKAWAVGAKVSGSITLRRSGAEEEVLPTP